MIFQPSVYQQAVFDFIKSDHGSAVIEAVAGSGKTTTLVEALKLIPSSATVTFLAFNKSIAEELKSRVPNFVKAVTFHSQGYSSLIRSNKNRLQVDSNKVARIVSEIFPEEEQIMYGSFVKKLTSIAKSAGVGVLYPDAPMTYMQLIDHHDLTLENEEASITQAIQMVRQVLEESIHRATVVIDFDDMLYMPAVNNTNFFRCDYLFVDEAQDCSPLQIHLLKKMLKPTGRLIAVGDSYQSLYGFRGADSEAMSRIARQFNAKVLPLSVSYRCPRAVVKAAKDYCPHIEPFEKSPLGKVVDLEEVHSSKHPEFQKTDAILCRNTQPLVNLAYTLIKKGTPVKILGRDFGQGLISLVKKMKAKGLDRLIVKLERFRNSEVQRYMDADNEQAAQAVQDRVDSVLAIIEYLAMDERTIPGLIRRIESLFTDDSGKDVLTLATVHKSKGLEWDRVFILERKKRMPSPWARKQWQKDQERNLIYVAYTRAKKELYLM